jgi:flagellar basal-body rod protein FlgB
MLDSLGLRLERYLDLLSARQKLVASNIANADTPGYRTKDIDFQFEFMSAAGSADQAAPPNVLETPGLQVKNDGNNVDMDREARLLAENAIRFNLASTLLHSQLQQIKTAILEGKSG